MEGFRYEHHLWGEWIYGSKADLCALGLGVGLAFPGEEGGPRPRGTLKVIDPRGLAASITAGKYWGPGFVASILFPGYRESEPPRYRSETFAFGVVKLLFANSGRDEFNGSAADLAAAGLLRLEQLPGQPGMRKVRVTILADGSIAGGVPTAPNRAAREPGARSIHRVGKNKYCVSVVIPKAEEEVRRAAWIAARDEWEKCMRAMPRPTPLIRLRRHELGLTVLQGGRPAETLSETECTDRVVQLRPPRCGLALVWDAARPSVG